ncbi:MAG: hypothetical protein ACKV2Q_07675 [Planctomycetaceae bacterium]
MSNCPRYRGALSKNHWHRHSKSPPNVVPSASRLSVSSARFRVRITHLAKQVRSVFRRALQISASQTDQVVWLLADNTGLRIRAQNKQAIIEYHLPGLVTPDAVPITMEGLAACEGTKADQFVGIDRPSEGLTVLRWDDRGIPQSFQFDAKKLQAEASPIQPETWVVNSPSLLGALADAMRIVPTDATRLALNCVQLQSLSRSSMPTTTTPARSARGPRSVTSSPTISASFVFGRAIHRAVEFHFCELVEFAVLTKTKVVTLSRYAVTPNAAKTLCTRRVVQRVWDAIDSGHFYPVPSPMNCPACPYRVPCRHWSG